MARMKSHEYLPASRLSAHCAIIDPITFFRVDVTTYEASTSGRVGPSALHAAYYLSH